MPTYADNSLNGLLQLNDRNLADMNVTDLLQDTPLLQVLFAKPASEGGVYHKYVKETTAAQAQFRAVNTGVVNTAGHTELVTVTCKYLDGHFYVDVAIANGFKSGRAAFMAMQTKKAMRALMVGLEKQILQSTGAADANGFSGLPDYASADSIADAMVVNAGGSGGRSVWALRIGTDDVAVVAGNEGNLNFGYDADSPPQLVVTNTSTGAGYMAYQVDLGGWFALQCGSIYSVARICNLDSTTSHTLTDDLLATAISKFPAGRGPTHFVMDRVLLAELRDSRTATNATGAPAPFPAEAFNIPIVVTDQASSAESALTTTTTTGQ